MATLWRGSRAVGYQDRYRDFAESDRCCRHESDVCLCEGDRSSTKTLLVLVMGLPLMNLYASYKWRSPDRELPWATSMLPVNH